MDQEMRSCGKSPTWILTDKQPKEKIITSRWIFRYKFDESGRIMRYKSRLVVRGCLA